MEKSKNIASLLIGGAGLCLQFGGLIHYLLAQADYGHASPRVIRTSLIVAGLGTALMVWGLSVNARGKWQSPWWGLMGVLSFLGAVIVACREDLHAKAQRESRVINRVADLPDDKGVAFYCVGCNYQLNGITGRSCPECGRPFNPDDLTTVTIAGEGLHDAPWMGRWSLICGIGGMLICGPVLSVVGITFGHIALWDIKKKHLPGYGVALAGLIISYIALALTAGMFVFMFLSW